MLQRWFGSLILVLWIFGLIAGEKEKDFNTCSFYYWRVDWATAVKTCQYEGKQLLCYKSKKEIDDITDAFRLSAFGTARLELWLSKRNCSNDQLESCLSLHIQKSGTTVWHFVQNECEENYPFVCCIHGMPETTTEQDHTSTLMNLTSDVFEITNSSLDTTTHQSSSSRMPFCQKIHKRGIDWPDTDVGTVAVLPCPGDSTGEASWTCGNSTRWNEIGPDMSRCRSLEIKSLKKRFNSSSASDVITGLESIFGKDKEIFADDLAEVITMMTSLPDKLFQEMDSLSSATKWAATTKNVNKTVAVMDRMVELDATWTDINLADRSLVGSHLLSTVDGIGLVLADSMPNNEIEQSIYGRNMVLQVQKPKPGDFVTFPRDDVTNRGGRISLDGQLGDEDNKNVSMVFALYTDMSKILSPAPRQKTQPILNSAVVSATITQGRNILSTSNEVRILVEHVTLNPNETVCVFWNMDRNIWDTTGCRLESSNESYSICVCNHLTNFALLMDYGDVLKDLEQLTFHYITLVGCYLSIMCLLVCIVVFSCYSYHSKHSWGLRYVIHRNLCICLLIGNIVLVTGFDSTSNERVCSVVAGLLHYFFLAAFSWMLLEAVHIYLLLVVVFASRRSHSEKYYIFGYGFPLIIVAVTAISRPTYYGTDEVCWLSTEKGTIWAFIGPIACILFLNVAALILAQHKASKISVKDDKAALIKRWLRVTVILFPILGITWVLGFLYLGNHFEVAGYLFTIFNSFQGVCIFVFHCLLDKKARNMIMDSFRKRASVNTGSSSTQKKMKEPEHQETKTNSVAPIDIDDSNQVNGKLRKTFQIVERNKKDWSKWYKPWSFCFKLPVSERKKHSNNEMEEKVPEAIVVNWNSLRDKNCCL